MKTFIHKTNQYLLERYPTLWNTRVVWMLLTAVVLHLIFFVFGLFTLTNPKLLHEYGVKDIFFDNGTVFLSAIISILLLVSWLIFMFKNNAFKNFYPTTTSKLFGQFMCYMLIIFSCSTFYLSYTYGLKTYIATTYPNDVVNKEISIANDAALFLTESISNYTLDQRRYPKPFNELYCESNTLRNYDSLPGLQFLDINYFYYTLYTKEAPISERFFEHDSTYKGYVFIKTTDSLRIYYFKDALVDPKPFVTSAIPSFYNASFTFFKSRNDVIPDDNNDYDYRRFDYSDYGAYSHSPEFSLRHQLRNKRNFELLQRNNPTEIKMLLEDFLAISKTYKVAHNLTADQWFELIYHPTDFEVKHFIRNEPKEDYEFMDYDDAEIPESSKYQAKRLTDFFYTKDNLYRTFYNIEDIKASNPFIDSIHVFMWLSFFFACVIFMFRITGLKPLLFSIITVGVLTLLISLFTAFLFYITQGSGDFEAFFAMYFTLAISILILAIPIVYSARIKKIIVAICVNISMIGFPLFLLLIVGIISAHQWEYCDNNRISTNYYDCPTLFESLGILWSYIFFIASLIFIWLYTKIIKNWKALPQG